MPQWTQKVRGMSGERLLEDVEARNVLTTDFLRHGVGETGGGGTITFYSVSMSMWHDGRSGGSTCIWRTGW